MSKATIMTNKPNTTTKRVVKLNFDSRLERQLLSRALATITEPARRHKCEEQAGGCGVVFECHLCSIADDHHLHAIDASSGRHPYLCEECIDRLGLHSVLICSGPSDRFTLVDYQTGEQLAVFVGLRLWRHTASRPSMIES